MALMDNDERSTVAAVAALTDCNPFLADRIDLEKRILGTSFAPTGLVWHADGDSGLFDPNLPRLRELTPRLTRGALGTAAATEGQQTQ